MIIVLAHFLSILLMVFPLLGVIILERVSYSPYSLVPKFYILSSEDIFNNPWSIYDKFGWEENWVKRILFVVAIFCVFGFIDLVLYYYRMSYP
jgi:hypothetical protein